MTDLSDISPGESETPEDTDVFPSIASFIESELDFATSHYNNGYLKRRVRSRMRRKDMDSYGRYFSLLKDNPEEQEELLDSLSINVTGFFRNQKVWDSIRDSLRNLTDRKSGPIRIWSAACADGREPYSIALLAHSDDKIDENRVEVLATDINETALEQAREGSYEKTTTQDVDQQLSYLDSYENLITRDENTFTVKDRVRKMVEFEQHDLIHGDEKSGFDLVMCRNLMIYIERQYEVPLLRSLCNAMNPGAYIVVGKAETVPKEIMQRFDVIDNRLRVYQLK